MGYTLVGFKAAGKTTLGRRLADYLGMHFIDTDPLIEEIHGKGMTCRQIVHTHGETYFRCLEREVVQDVMDRPSLVLATGGGVVECAQNRHQIREKSEVIFLDVSFEVLKARIQPLGYFAWDRLEFLFEKRRSMYLQVAHRAVPSDDWGQAWALLLDLLC